MEPGLEVSISMMGAPRELLLTDWLLVAMLTGDDIQDTLKLCFSGAAQ
jgi:hypothetical protein